MTLKTKLQQQLHTQSNSRRQFLQLGLGLTAGLSTTSNVFATALKPSDRKLSLTNLHTGERLNATYWAEGEYQTGELIAINKILRDHRTGDIETIDTHLIEYLNLLHSKVGIKQSFEVFSGYRSPKSNTELRHTTTGVAKKSYHTKGMAVDIRLPKCQLATLHNAAINLKIGGVGKYSRSGFIHIDTGNVRNWVEKSS